MSSKEIKIAEEYRNYIRSQFHTGLLRYDINVTIISDEPKIIKTINSLGRYSSRCAYRMQEHNYHFYINVNYNIYFGDNFILFRHKNSLKEICFKKSRGGNYVKMDKYTFKLKHGYFDSSIKRKYKIGKLLNSFDDYAVLKCA